MCHIVSDIINIMTAYGVDMQTTACPSCFPSSHLSSSAILASSALCAGEYDPLLTMQTSVARLLRFPRNRTRALHLAHSAPCGFSSILPLPIFQTSKSAPRLDRTYVSDRASPGPQETFSGDAAAHLEGKTESRLRPSSIKSINKALAKRKAPELVEEDLVEQFVRGTGSSCSSF